MKKNDIKALQEKSIAELNKMSFEIKKSLAMMGLDHSQFKLKNTSEISTKKDDLARVLTVLKAKEETK